MKRYSLISLTLFLIACSDIPSVDKLRIGNYQANIKIPDGFTIITEGPVFDSLQEWEEPELKPIAYLFDAKELELVIGGVQTSFDRYHTLAINKEFRNFFFQQTTV